MLGAPHLGFSRCGFAVCSVPAALDTPLTIDAVEKTARPQAGLFSLAQCQSASVVTR